MPEFNESKSAEKGQNLKKSSNLRGRWKRSQKGKAQPVVADEGSRPGEVDVQRIKTLQKTTKPSGQKSEREKGCSHHKERRASHQGRPSQGRRSSCERPEKRHSQKKSFWGLIKHLFCCPFSNSACKTQHRRHSSTQRRSSRTRRN